MYCFSPLLQTVSMCIVNQNVTVAVAPTTQHSPTVAAVASAFAVCANVTGVPTTKWYRANIVNVTISRANGIRACCAADRSVAHANVENVVAIPAGRVSIVHAVRPMTPACRRAVVKFARAMVYAFAARASVKRRVKIAIPANTVTNAPHAQADAKNSRTVCNVKFSKPAQWATIQICVRPIVRFKPPQSMWKLSKPMSIRAIISALSTMKTIANSNSFITTTMSKILRLMQSRSWSVQRRYSFLALWWVWLHPLCLSVWHCYFCGKFSPPSMTGANLPNSKRNDDRPNGIR